MLRIRTSRPPRGRNSDALGDRTIAEESREIIIVGAGGHAHVVIDSLRLQGHAIKGAVDPALRVGERFMGIPVLGGDEAVWGAEPTQILLANGIVARP